MLRLANWVIAIAVAIISISLWAYINRPQPMPEWPERVTGFAFSPYQADQDPREQQYPTVEQIKNDLQLLQGKVTAIRTYSVEGTLSEIPRLAKEHKLLLDLSLTLIHLIMKQTTKNR